MASDVSVVIQTVLRPTLLRSIKSIIDQDFDGIIDIQIGIDIDGFGMADFILDEIKSMENRKRRIFILNPGYSTASRREGVSTNQYGGNLRSILTFLSLSRYVAYLDDDDWFEPNHISSLMKAIQNKYWAFSLCNYSVSNDSHKIDIDLLESVGPGKGIYKEKFGGFVRPSALILDQLALASLIFLWNHSPFENGAGQDRNIFNALKVIIEFGETNIASVNYSLDPKDSMHEQRINYLSSKGHNLIVPQNQYTMRDWLNSNTKKS